jgi:hypothetical protein
LGAREVVLKIAAKHADPKALDLLVREFTSAGTSMRSVSQEWAAIAQR